MLLLDPFVRLHRINENDAGDVAAILGYLRDLQRAHDLAIVVVHHARKNGGSTTGGQSLRGSGDFFAWVDTALSLRRRHQQLALSVEHRAARAPDPVTLALVGTEQDLHLARVGAPDAPPEARPAPADFDATLLHTLDQAGGEGLPRAALRAALHVRNARLGDALARLTAAGHLTRHGDTWVRRPVPASAPPDMRRNGNAMRPDG